MRTRILAALIAIGAATGSVVWAETASSSPTKPAYTPDQCIQRNGGDYNACNVGNSGRGDLPYLPVNNKG
jgi:hypothetical protein